MRSRVACASLMLTVLGGLFTKAEAAPNGQVKIVYKVQVEYWYWDSNYTYRATILETEDGALANLLYDALVEVKANGSLQAVVPHPWNWRYVPIDVHLEEEKTIIPNYFPEASNEYSKRNTTARRPR